MESSLRVEVQQDGGGVVHTGQGPQAQDPCSSCTLYLPSWHKDWLKLIYQVQSAGTIARVDDDKLE